MAFGFLASSQRSTGVLNLYFIRVFLNDVIAICYLAVLLVGQQAEHPAYKKYE